MPPLPHLDLPPSSPPFLLYLPIRPLAVHFLELLLSPLLSLFTIITSTQCRTRTPQLTPLQCNHSALHASFFPYIMQCHQKINQDPPSHAKQHASTSTHGASTAQAPLCSLLVYIVFFFDEADFFFDEADDGSCFKPGSFTVLAFWLIVGRGFAPSGVGGLRSEGGVMGSLSSRWGLWGSSGIA